MKKFQASVFRDGELFVAQCLEIDIVSQGETAAEAIENLREALALFFEVAPADEIAQRLHDSVDVSQVVAKNGFR